MGAPERSARATAALGLALTCLASAACGASQTGPAIGTSSEAAGAGAGRSVDGGTTSAAPLPNPLPSDFRTSMTHVSSGRFLSRGHAGGRWDAEIYADSAGVAALRGQATAAATATEPAAIPVGTRFVEEHFERNDAGAGPIMVMEKRPAGFDPARGDWRYTAIGARGNVVKDGAVESCAGCHGEAPGDHVFRITAEP